MPSNIYCKWIVINEKLGDSYIWVLIFFRVIHAGQNLTYSMMTISTTLNSRTNILEKIQELRKRLPRNTAIALEHFTSEVGYQKDDRHIFQEF